MLRRLAITCGAWLLFAAGLLAPAAAQVNPQPVGLYCIDTSTSPPSWVTVTVQGRCVGSGGGGGGVVTQPTASNLNALAAQGAAGTSPWLVTGTGGTFPVTGTFWQTTQPVSGTFWQATQPVSIASMPSTPVTGTFWQATQPVSGTVTANQGTANTAANGWPAKITDGTNTAAVKAASTSAAATDPAVVTTTSPNSPEVPFAGYSKSSITRSANTTTYTANTGWNNGTPTFFSFTVACRVNGGQVLIPKIDIWSSANPTLKLTGILWLFSAVPGTNISDDATFTIASADFANLTGNFSGFSFALANNQAAAAANSSATIVGTTYQAQCASGTTTITGMVQVTNAYVPASAEVLNIGIATVGAN